MKSVFFDLAFQYAEKAYELNEVPIGAVIVKNNEVIGYGFNTKEKDNSVIQHAEIKAIEMAERKLKNWRLDDCDIYVTLDPCPMCASAIKQARIKNVFSAVCNLDPQNTEIIEKIFANNDYINHKITFSTNNYAEKSKKMLNSFFKTQREKKY